MRPLTQFPQARFLPAPKFYLALAAAIPALCGCGGGAASVAPPPPPASAVSVTVTPATATLLLGNTEAFKATASNTSNTAVTWSVNGVSGGNAAAGTITSDGTYTAPADLPSQPSVTITATSQADPSKSGSATLALSSDIVVAVAPSAANAELGSTQTFHASVSSSGKPDTAVTWSLAGAACPASCGTIDANGNYTAPGILPGASTVTITAQSVADPTKQGTASVVITSNFTLALTAPGTIAPGASAILTATLTPVPGSQPSTGLTWSVSGSGCAGATCGTISAVTTQSASTGASSWTTTYTAPTTTPSPNSIVVTVTPVADPSTKAQATIGITSGGSPSISPGVATLALNHRVTLTAQFPGIASSAAAWSVNGIAGGNANLGQICAVASAPCQPVTSGALQADYVAPGAVPQPDPVARPRALRIVQYSQARR